MINLQMISNITNRESFKRYIKAMLGEPLAKVNVTDEQMEYCINDALQVFTQWHSEGSIRTFLKQIVTPSILKVTQPNLNDIAPGALITGMTSHATATVCTPKRSGGNEATDLKLERAVTQNGCIACQDILNRDFLPGEQIDIAGKKYTLQNSPDFMTKGIIDERKFKVPDWVLGITRLMPANDTMSSQSLFSAEYQIRLNDLWDLSSSSLIYYEQAMEHLDLLSFELSARPCFEFNQYEGYCYPICKWKVDFNVGDYIICEVFRAVDPKTSWRVWNEPWLKKYATALVKKVFGQNLKKYANMQLPGGITFNGDSIYQEAVQEIQQLEDSLQSVIPVGCFMIG